MYPGDMNTIVSDIESLMQWRVVRDEASLELGVILWDGSRRHEDYLILL